MKSVEVSNRIASKWPNFEYQAPSLPSIKSGQYDWLEMIVALISFIFKSFAHFNHNIMRQHNRYGVHPIVCSFRMLTAAMLIHRSWYLSLACSIRRTHSHRGTSFQFPSAFFSCELATGRMYALQTSNTPAIAAKKLATFLRYIFHLFSMHYYVAVTFAGVCHC